MHVKKSLKSNVEILKNKLPSDDLSFLDIKVGKVPATLIFVNDLTDKEHLGELVLRPAAEFKGKLTPTSFFNAFYSPEKTKAFDFDSAITDLLLGNTLLIVDGIDFILSFGLKQFEKRAITEPPTSTVIKGPREGFVELLPINVSLIRRKLKTPELRIENMEIGKFSKTPIAICYLNGIARPELVKKLKQNLKKIDIDAVLDSSYLSKFLGDRRTSLFKQVGNTEKPDILAAKLLEGRVAVIVDGSPIVLTVPYLLIEDFQSASDYYNSAYSATTARFLRLLSVIISLFLPAVYVAAELFHLQLIPLSFLLTIVNSIKGIPLSPSYEMFFTLMIFEILNEASVRMPKYVGMVVSIVGGLVLGETAVTAGIISAPTLMIVALSGICLYTVPELEQIFSVLRIVFLIIAGSGGLYTLLLGIATLIIYLISFENFGTPILAPFSPLITADMKDAFYKGFMGEHAYRPLSIPSKNKKRLKVNDKEN